MKCEKNYKVKIGRAPNEQCNEKVNRDNKTGWRKGRGTEDTWIHQIE